MQQTDRVVRLLRDVFDADLVGVYLYGSAVLGGLGPRSDLDIFAVTRRETTGGERRDVAAGLLQISGPFPPSGDDRPVEVTIVALPEVRPWRHPARMEFHYGEWLRTDFENGVVPEPAISPDLSVLVTMVLLGGVPLLGPPPGDVFAPVPQPDLVRAMTDGVPGLLADLDEDTCNVLLTFARIWMTLSTGTIGPKDAAADWALERLPEQQRAVLMHARDIHRGDAQDVWAGREQEVRVHVDHVVDEIEQLASQV